MVSYIEILRQSFISYADYLWRLISTPSWDNYLYFLIILSAVVWLLEITIPWRHKQAFIRKDFWLDTFYMFFNFFLFNLIMYNALSNIGIRLVADIFGFLNIKYVSVISVLAWPQWAQLLLLFFMQDFIQWCTHRLLHRSQWLWRFHKIHHSVMEMGFAAHLRYHPVETIIYKSFLYIPLTVIGFEIDKIYLMHYFTIIIGHLNHSNINLNYGFLKYIFNSPKMHIWHHAKHLPAHYKHGVNFGITLSLWDYLFNSAYMPDHGKDIPLGFENVENYPTSFLEQLKRPFERTKE